MGARGVAMTSAGASAHVGSERPLAEPDYYDTTPKYNVDLAPHKAVIRRLSVLSTAGYTLLPDRSWPGMPTARVDLIVVGPSGVFIIDVASWNDVQLRAGNLFSGQRDVTDELLTIAEFAYQSEQVFTAVGLAPGEVHAVAVLSERRGFKAAVGPVQVVGEHDILQHIARGGKRLTGPQVAAVLAAALAHFPALAESAPGAASATDPMLSYQAGQFDISSFDDVNSAIMAGTATAPTEDWMSFLHPDQARLVRRSFDGPSRIRGAAGTGKTIVALHRAAYLARATSGRVLVATNSKALPAVLTGLLRRMSPETAGRVDFGGVQAFAVRLVRERGIRCSLDPKATDTAFSSAWRDVGLSGSLALIDQSARYWQDEIDYVIKGRGIRTFETYAELARTGRRQPLGIEHRRAVWELYVAYEQRLRAAGIHDVNDVIALAEASLIAQPLDTYRAVIVDEAQDLSCSAIRMLHRLVGNSPDGLTLVSDGRQTIYPGGYSLTEAGVGLAGRGVVMMTNYRNTAEILALANSTIAGLEATDIEGPDESDAAPIAVRGGPAPIVIAFAERHEHDAALVAHLDELTYSNGHALTDIAILTLDRFTLAPVMMALSSAGIPTIDLDTYDGSPVNAIKVGTVKNAKGLQFGHVIIAGVKESLVSATVPAEASAFEKYELQRRELYVAITRARDGLWVGIVR